MPQLLKDFFDCYSDQGFIYNPTESPTSESCRLCKSYNWNPSDSGLKQTPFFTAALVRELDDQRTINAMYGKNVSEFRHWEQLYRVLDFELSSVDEPRAVGCSSHFRLLSWLVV